MNILIYLFVLFSSVGEDFDEVDDDGDIEDLDQQEVCCIFLFCFYHILCTINLVDICTLCHYHIFLQEFIVFLIIKIIHSVIKRLDTTKLE